MTKKKRRKYGRASSEPATYWGVRVGQGGPVKFTAKTESECREWIGKNRLLGQKYFLVELQAKELPTEASGAPPPKKFGKSDGTKKGKKGEKGKGKKGKGKKGKKKRGSVRPISGGLPGLGKRR